jgi:hypothetical protein
MSERKLTGLVAMLSIFRRRPPQWARIVSAGLAKAQPTAPQTLNGLPVVAAYADGSVEVAGMHRNFLVSPRRRTWAPID